MSRAAFKAQPGCLLPTADCLPSSLAARLRLVVLRLLASGRLQRRGVRRLGGLDGRGLDLLRRVAGLRLAVIYSRVGRGDLRLRRLRVRVLLWHGLLCLCDRLRLAMCCLPGGEAAEQGARLEAFVAEYLRRTGAGVLLRSRAVGDDLPVAREFREARFELVERDVGRALDLRRGPDPHVEDADFALGAQSLELFERDAVGRTLRCLRRGALNLRARR